MRKLCTILVLSLVATLPVALGCVTRTCPTFVEDLASSLAFSAKQPIVVQLVIPDEVFDPDNPSANTIRCVVRNHSKKVITVPDGYGSGMLTADFALPKSLHLHDRKGVEPGKVAIPPGEEYVVFELSLQDVLLKTFPAEEGSRWEWVWVWSKSIPPVSCEPPESPIGLKGKWLSNTFQVGLPWWTSETDFDWVFSNEVQLRVKGDEDMKKCPDAACVIRSELQSAITLSAAKIRDQQSKIQNRRDTDVHRPD